ncbi:MAG: DNA polymerase [Opitutaceae bacterium]|nr:DNA polymerase [Opitutaceae bacterium]
MDTLCGLWIDGDGVAHLSLATEDGQRITRTATFQPFAWAGSQMLEGDSPDIKRTSLRGTAPYSVLVQAESLKAYEAWLSRAKSTSGLVDSLRPLESQFLLQNRQRLFSNLPFSGLRRCQMDIETGSENGTFSNASRGGDRILAIGLQFGTRNRTLVLTEMSNAGERSLLEKLNQVLAEEDPDTIEGHNLFKFDLEYLRIRCRRLKVACKWGRFNQDAGWRSARLKVAERWIDFPRCDIPGRAVVDSFLLVHLYDIAARELTSFGLKEVAVALGITSPNAAAEGTRTYLPGDKIQDAFLNERERFLHYLADDLRETRGIVDRLLPTYFEQTKTFPILLQDAMLRGTTTKIDLLFLEEYFHARESCPAPPEVRPFEGGFTRSYQEGVFHHVLHFDVASLYPSLLLGIGRNPKADTLGVFIPLLKQLRTYRLQFKQLARTAPTAEERMEAQARQSSFKVLINSFYGYLGFSGARFGDGDLAAEVTRRGRELLQVLIGEFQKHDCVILEADTDGIYLSSKRYFAEPESLLAVMAPILPPGIELEFDGRFDAMFCYKAKNYALRAGDAVTFRGSALRSRGMEPYLKVLTDQMIQFLLGLKVEAPSKSIERLRRQISDRSLPVEQLARTENLSMGVDAYEKFVAGGGKPRRASAEAALMMASRPKAGDRVSYYITIKKKGEGSDWQRARPVSLFDAVQSPYDPEHYLEKLDDWIDRYGSYLGIKRVSEQTEFKLE